MGAVKRNTLSVLFIIKKNKLLKNADAPVCMRITVNKRVAEIMIRRSIPVDLWNQKKECSKGKDRIATELSHYISTVRAKVLQIHRELEIGKLHDMYKNGIVSQEERRKGKFVRVLFLLIGVLDT